NSILSGCTSQRQQLMVRRFHAEVAYTVGQLKAHILRWTLDPGGGSAPEERTYKSSGDEEMDEHSGKGRISRRGALKDLGGILTAAAVSGSMAPFAAQAQQGGGRAGTLPRRPNILWITGEGVPVSMLSCYGSQLIQTPHIDRLATEGMRFGNSFCTNALCAPSRATLLTGTYNHVNGMYGNPGIPATTGTLPPHFD